MPRHPFKEPRLVAGPSSAMQQTTLSWSRDGVPQSPESNPAAVFDRLFAADNAQAKTQREAQQRRKMSILDPVQSDFKRLEGRVSKRDREVLDQYATAVREVETRVRRAEQWAKKPKSKVDAKRSPSIGDDKPTEAQGA